MASVNLKKLITIKKLDPIVKTINEQEVVIQQYVPITKQAEAINKVLGYVFDEERVFSPVRYEIYALLAAIEVFTNINITDAMWEKADETYDHMVLNGIDKILDDVKTYQNFQILLKECINTLDNHNHSALGTVRAMATDYDNTKFNVDELMRQLTDDNQVGLVKEVLDKMG